MGNNLEAINFIVEGTSLVGIIKEIVCLLNS